MFSVVDDDNSFNYDVLSSLFCADFVDSLKGFVDQGFVFVDFFKVCLDLYSLEIKSLLTSITVTYYLTFEDWNYVFVA